MGHSHIVNIACNMMGLPILHWHDTVAKTATIRILYFCILHRHQKPSLLLFSAQLPITQALF